MLTASIDLLNTRETRVIRWPGVAYAAFALAMQNADTGLLADLDEIMRLPRVVVSPDGTATMVWEVGVLGLTAPVRVAPAEVQDRVFRESVGGKPVPIVRLSEERLAP